MVWCSPPPAKSKRVLSYVLCFIQVPSLERYADLMFIVHQSAADLRLLDALTQGYGTKKCEDAPAAPIYLTTLG